MSVVLALGAAGLKQVAGAVALIAAFLNGAQETLLAEARGLFQQNRLLLFVAGPVPDPARLRDAVGSFG